MASLVLFDGVCNMCNGFVQFVIARDPDGCFQFGALQSSAARRVLDLHDRRGAVPETLVLIEDGDVFTASTAALRVARRLPFPWRLAAIFLATPRPLRDWIYGAIARRRYRWFGKRDHCMVPAPEIRSRFID